MRHSTARKLDPIPQPQARAEIFDFKRLEAMKVAVEAEKSCHLQANADVCDFEEFMLKYGITSAGYFE